MELNGRIAVVTGGAGGIGRALAHRFVAEGARRVVVVDIQEAAAQRVAEEVGGVAMTANVGVEADIIRVVRQTEAEIGPIDLFVSNAGIATNGGVDALDADWERSWAVNVMSQVYAARAVIPLMAARGGGYLLNTASAAGLLNQIGSAPYGVTKHASVGLAEFLSITYRDQGIRVSVLCPQAVRTAMTAGLENGGVAGVDGMIEPEQLADTVIEALRDERFLILPHPQVLTYMRRKTDDYDRWLAGMRRLKQRYDEAGTPAAP